MFIFFVVSTKKKSNVPLPRQHINEKPSLYYVTLKVRNRAGKKSIIAPSYKGLNQGFHINTGSIMKITREFQSSEPLILKAFDPDSHSAMMINNRKSIIVKPAKFKDRVTDIVISPLSKCFYVIYQTRGKLCHQDFQKTQKSRCSDTCETLFQMFDKASQTGNKYQDVSKYYQMVVSTQKTKE